MYQTFGLIMSLSPVLGGEGLCCPIICHCSFRPFHMFFCGQSVKWALTRSLTLAWDQEGCLKRFTLTNKIRFPCYATSSLRWTHVVRLQVPVPTSPTEDVTLLCCWQPGLSSGSNLSFNFIPAATNSEKTQRQPWFTGLLCVCWEKYQCLLFLISYLEGTSSNVSVLL